MWILFAMFATLIFLFFLWFLPSPSPHQYPSSVTVEIPVTGQGNMKEQNGTPYATTPINKLDDYEFLRVFGLQQGDKMIPNPRENYNKILLDRQITKENFVNPTSVKELTTTYSLAAGNSSQCEDSKDKEKEKEIKRIVERIYEDDPDWEPIITRVGANRWEVTELKQKHRLLSRMEHPDVSSIQSNVSVQHTLKPIDPYFSGIASQTADPYQGTVPGMERMFAPTFDTTDWSMSHYS